MTNDRYSGLMARAFVLLLVMFVICSGGRLNSSDAHAQLQQSMILAVTGKVKTFDPPADTFAGKYWVGNSITGFYEKQDPGNMLLMLPSTWIAYHLMLRSGRHPTEVDIEHPPLVANFLVGMTETVIAALACTFLFGYFLFRFSHIGYSALLTLGFVAGTYYAVYSKSAWDVCAGAAVMSAVVYYSAIALSLGTDLPKLRRAASLVPLCVSFIIIVLFRSELIFFLGAAMLAVVCIVMKFSRREIGLLFGALLVLVVCIGTFNFVTTGAAFTISKITGGTLSTLFSGNFWHGIYGNTVAPNHGSIIFAPILLMILPIVIPAIRRNIPLTDKKVITIYGTMVVFYLLVISKLLNWAPQDCSWGPRYTVTMLPILYVISINVAVAAGKKWGLICAVALLVVGAAINIPASLVNTELALTTDQHITSPLAPQPREVEAVWNALSLGIHGRHLPISADPMRGPGAKLASGFPDIWWIRAFGHTLDVQRAMLLLLSVAFALLFVVIGRKLHYATPAPQGIRG